MSIRKPGARLLVVDDDEALRGTIDYALSRQGYSVASADTPDRMFQELERNPYLVLLLDVFLDDGDSLRHLSRLRSEYPDMQIIMMTGSGTIDMAVEAIRLGVYDFITKPIDIQRLNTSVRAAIRLSRHETVSTPEAAASETGVQQILGFSDGIRSLKEVIEKVANSSCTVLIVGETGTGKELVAQAIHHQSSRGDRVMPVVNCGALPAELVESELFGHERGAFTGATQARAGYAEQAQGSTLFLDEIGEMPIGLQPKLLRFLQNKTFHRVGGTRETTVDARVVCATNRDPTELVSRDRLREDLYYRMSQITIRVPSLRERKQDIPLLANTFLQRLRKGQEVEPPEFEAEAMDLLSEYHWPGNVRHLLNVITELVVLHDSARVSVDMLPTDIVQSVRDRHPGDRRQPCDPLAPRSVPRPAPAIQPLREAERQLMQRALTEFNGNVIRAARELQVSPATLYRKIQRYGLKQSAVSNSFSRSGDR